jgi:hypothetical protein
MLLITSAVKTLLSISQNSMDQITLNKPLGNHLNKDITNASRYLSTNMEDRTSSLFLYQGPVLYSTGPSGQTSS